MVDHTGDLLLSNYRYALSAWIYKMLNRADADFAMIE